MNTIEKIMFLKQKILSSKVENAEIYLNIIDDFIETMISYIKCIFVSKSHQLIKTFHSQEDIKHLIEKADRNRKIFHDSLITYTKLMDNLCILFNTPMIFGKFGPYIKDVSRIINPITIEEKDLHAEISIFAVKTISDLSEFNYTSDMLTDADKYNVLDKALSEKSAEDIRKAFYSKINKI